MVRIVIEIKRFSPHRSSPYWEEVNPKRITGRYVFRNGVMFVEIKLWFMFWFFNNWIAESDLRFVEEEMYECNYRR